MGACQQTQKSQNEPVKIARVTSDSQHRAHSGNEEEKRSMKEKSMIDNDHIQYKGSLLLQLWLQSGGKIISTNVSNVSVSHSKTMTLRITQIEVAQQSDGDESCGYYAIYFASKMNQIFNNAKDIIVKQLFHDLRSNESFLNFKEQIMQQLLNECGRRKYVEPWTKEHIRSGVFERSYLQYLQNNDSATHQLQMVYNDGNIKDEYPEIYNTDCVANKYGFKYLYDCINLMEFNDSSLRRNHLPLTTIDYLEFFFNEKFVKKQENYKVFLIGAAIHYFTCAIYRDPDATHIDILYLDPQNSDILNKSNEFLKSEVINAMKFESWLKFGWKLNSMRLLALDSFTGIQFIVTELLPNTIRNLYSTEYNKHFLRDSLITININEGFIGSFKYKVLLPMIRYININQTHDTQSSADSVHLLSASEWNDHFVTIHNIDENEGYLDINKWDETCDSMQHLVTQKINNIQSNGDVLQLQDVQTCYALIEVWINKYYPPSIIESNIVNVLSKLENADYIPQQAMDLLSRWSSFMMIFCDEANRKVAKIKNDEFWDRLASTIYLVQIITESDSSITRAPTTRLKPPRLIPDIKQLCFILEETVSTFLDIKVHHHHNDRAAHQNVASELFVDDKENVVEEDGETLMERKLAGFKKRKLFEEEKHETFKHYINTNIINTEFDIFFMIAMYTYYANESFYCNYESVLEYCCLLYYDIENDKIVGIIMSFLATSISFEHLDEIEYESNDSVIKFCVATKDFLNIRSKQLIYTLNMEDVDTILINCYVMSKGDEMWIGVVAENVFEAHEAVERKENALFYYGGRQKLIGTSKAFGFWDSGFGAIHAFGTVEKKDIKYYQHGHWITFLIKLKEDNTQSIKIFNDDDCVYEGNKLPSSDGGVYFVCIMDDPIDAIFVERAMYIK